MTEGLTRWITCDAEGWSESCDAEFSVSGPDARNYATLMKAARERGWTSQRHEQTKMFLHFCPVHSK